MQKPTLGGVPERSKGTDCKSVGHAFGGSNPPPSTSQYGMVSIGGESVDEEDVGNTVKQGHIVKTTAIGSLFLNNK
jgi:hypothetical protein